MDDRAKTLSALDAFIASQRALLARTHDDIERLRGLKGEVVRDPEAFFDSVDEQLDSPSFRLSDAGDAYNLAFKHTIEWGAFTGCDPTPLLTLPTPSLPPRSPLRTQSTPLSPLQSLVKSARRTLIDPVLTLFPPPTPLSDFELAGLGGLPVNAEEEKRRREHEKIREMKRMVRAGGKGYSYNAYGNGNARGGGLRVPKQAVFVREDVEDESVIQVDVDVGMDIDGGESATPTPATLPIPMVGGIKQEEPMDVIDTIPSPPPPPPPSKFRSRAKVPPSAPAPRTSSRRSTRTTAPPAASTTPVAASPAASTSASSRPAKRVKVKHECVEEEEEEDEGEDDPATSYECADGAYGYRAHANGVYGGKAPSSSSTPPLYNGGGGKIVDAVSIGRVGSSAPSFSLAGGSVGGKSLEALGLGPTSTSKGKTKGGLGGAASSGSTPHNGAAKDVPTKQTGKGKGTREKEDAKKEKKEKPRPETYKQAWSVEEQRMLEQLLEEIPEGEGFRWQKISRAMGGRRTPRQVASRVQKYFEKLKRFGVG